MIKETFGGKVAGGFFWKVLESGGDQLITFLLSVVLARLLGPEKYGTMSVMLIFVTFAGVIVQSGFQTSLIQKKEVTEEDYVSVWRMELLLAVLLYGLIFLLAPSIASFFEDEEIGPMLRILSLILFTGAVLSVLNAKIAREFRFRTQCIATVLADLTGGIAGVIAALAGAGTWALVFQQLVKNLALAVLLVCFLRWHPSGNFCFEKVKGLFSYGWKILLSGLIDTAYNNLYTPVIGKLMGTAEVGLYNRANQFPQVVANTSATSLQSVLLPAFSKIQGEETKEETRLLMKNSLQVSGYILFPVMFGMMAVSRPMVRVFLGEAWMEAVPMLRLCCLSFSVWQIHVINLQVINANGRSDIYLKMEILKKTAGVLLLFLSARGGIPAMLFTRAVFDYVCTFINAFPNGKIAGYPPVSQWKDMLKEFGMAAVMAVCAFLAEPLLGFFGIGTESFGGAFLVLCIQIVLGVCLYAVLSLALKPAGFRILYAWLLRRSGRKEKSCLK